MYMDLAVLRAVGLVHHHDSPVVLDRDRRQGRALTRRGNDDLGGFDQVVPDRLVGDQVNPVGSGRVLFPDQHVDVRTGPVGRYRRDVAAQVVDVGKPVVRRLSAGRHVAELGRPPLSMMMPPTALLPLKSQLTPPLLERFR